MTSSQLLDFLRTEGIAWVQSQRGTLRPLGRPLGTHESQQLASYFDGDHLATVRITQVPSISNPPFYATLAQQGIGIPLDFTVMAGITFIDTVAISRANPLPRDQWLPLLFHELVHVVQYRILGLQEFIRRYITSTAGRRMASDTKRFPSSETPTNSTPAIAQAHRCFRLPPPLRFNWHEAA